MKKDIYLYDTSNDLIGIIPGPSIGMVKVSNNHINILINHYQSEDWAPFRIPYSVVNINQFDPALNTQPEIRLINVIQ